MNWLCGSAGSLLRHRTVSARSASVMRQESSCASKGFLYCLPIVTERCLSLTLSFPGPRGQGEDAVAAPVPPALSCLCMRAPRVGFPGCCLMSRIRNIRWAWGLLAPLTSRFLSVLSLDMYDRRARCGSSRAPPASAEECYLVDPASSHMLVSKIKPCMSKYKLIYTVKLRMAH